MKHRGLFALSIGVLAALILAPGADAQTVNGKAKEKVRWYNAPREMQIIDDRPIIKDFREAPAAPQNITLPPGPMGAPGFSGGGGGAMGDDGGGTLPSGGMPIGQSPGQPAYRTDAPGGPIGLPKADFGHAQTNIPARGMGPKGPLPGGFSTGLHAKVMPFAKAAPNSVGPAMAGSRGGANTRVTPSMPVASYGGGYGAPSSGYGAGTSSSATAVHGTLLKHLK